MRKQHQRLLKTPEEAVWMAIDKARIRRAFHLYMKNPYWRAYYETAPSELCREYIRLDFASDDPEINAARLAMHEKLGLEDWKHLRKYAGNNPFHGRCTQMIQKLEAEQA